MLVINVTRQARRFRGTEQTGCHGECLLLSQINHDHSHTLHVIQVLDSTYLHPLGISAY